MKKRNFEGAPEAAQDVKTKEKDRSAVAAEYFRQGYNCAQSVVAAFCDKLNVDFETAVKAASSFGGGMGRLREVCGALTGTYIVIGLMYGYTNPADKTAKTEHYALVQDFAKKFKEKNGSIVCRELLGVEGAENPVPEDRTAEYYAERPCERIIRYAAEILNNFIKIKEKQKMKIAVACEGANVTEHFGHCENFTMFDVADGVITGIKAVPNPGHRPGFLPNYLNGLGANVIISGGMGGGAVDIFNGLKIEIVTGASGDAKTAVEDYLSGKLKTTGAVCHEHQHKDECGE